MILKMACNLELIQFLFLKFLICCFIYRWSQGNRNMENKTMLKSGIYYKHELFPGISFPPWQTLTYNWDFSLINLFIYFTSLLDLPSPPLLPVLFTSLYGPASPQRKGDLLCQPTLAYHALVVLAAVSSTEAQQGHPVRGKGYRGR